MSRKRLVLYVSLAFSVILLNLFFFQTSDMLYYLLPHQSYVFIEDITFYEVSALETWLRVPFLVVVDVESAVLTLVIAACTLLLSVTKGLVAASLRTIQVASLLFSILPLEVYFYNNSSFFEFFVTIQAMDNIAPWFTNADLLVVSACSLGLSTFFLLAMKPNVRG